MSRSRSTGEKGCKIEAEEVPKLLTAVPFSFCIGLSCRQGSGKGGAADHDSFRRIKKEHGKVQVLFLSSSRIACSRSAALNARAVVFASNTGDVFW